MLGDTDGKFYRRYLRGLTREIRYLRYSMLDIPDGVPRLQVLIALCYASLCLANQARHIRTATRKLSDELQRQILPDGGHISRNPGALIELLIDLLPLRQTFAARKCRNHPKPSSATSQSSDGGSRSKIERPWQVTILPANTKRPA